MSKKQWMVLLMLFLTYLLLGASIFYHIESRLEIERVEKAKHERIEINALLHAHYVPSHSHDHDEILGKLTRYCGKSVYNYTENETDPLKWDFYNSFYFAYTVVSTIGYGNLAPTNMLGRILMIFYGLIGIPINGILLAQLGEFFGRVFVKAHQKYKSYKHARNDYCPSKLTTFETRKLGLAAQIFVYLMPGFVMFIFFPAFLFSHYEGWTYDEAVYYAFVTLTTIGFGDYVAGQDNSKGSGIFFILYKTFLICWISFGLGYIVMIMTFIARGMRSKKITRIEHKLATNLKHTQSKIWNEFNKEINYLRRVFNELQLSKVKRVYVDECNYEIPRAKFPRSSSFPDLRDILHTGKGNESVIRHRPRRRANSEIVPTEDQIARVVSETDLQRIDKTATFASHAMVQPAELLARLVNILGYIPPATDDIGADCSNQTTFVQQESQRNGKVDDTVVNDISEKETIHAPGSGPGGWTIGPNDRIPRFPRLRSRAASEIRLQESKKNEDRHVEWTWSGATASKTIQELMKARSYESSTKDRVGGGDNGAASVKEHKFSTKLRSFSLAKSVPKALISSAPWKHRFSIGTEKKHSDLERNANSKDVEASFVPREPFSCLDNRRDSDVTCTSRRNYYTHTGAPNDHSEKENSNLLEETSLADFVRALSFLHASVATTGSWTAAATSTEDRVHETRPQRKMGIASLSPPKLPSLFTLFSSNPVGPTTTQANRNTITRESNGTQPISRDTRTGSLAFGGSTILKSRRFSLRPVATPISPPTPPRSGSPFLSESRRMSYENKSTFLFESPKEPLIRTENGPGFSSPMVPLPGPNNGRRFSLRPIQNQTGGIPTEETAATGVTTLKALPRWKAGMLQRQIGQKNLRRRVRAFSLSDVHVDDVGEKIEHTMSPSHTREKNDAEIVHENESRGMPTDGNHLVTSTEHTDRSVSSIEPIKERFTSFPRVVCTSTRFDDKNVGLADPCSQLIDRSTTERERDHVVPLQSTKFGSFKNSTDTRFFTDTPLINKNRRHESLAATTDATSHHPLVQVKIETPVTTTTFQSAFSNTNTNTLSDDFLRLTEVKTEKHNSRSYHKS